MSSKNSEAPKAATFEASKLSATYEKPTMNSIATAVFTINVPFHGAELYVINHNGEPYTPMKPIIDGMGMDWASQFTKLKQRFKTTVVEITMVAADGKSRSMICLALRKLAAWLNTISPNKVKAEMRERVIRYQEECDDVLYEYWTKGQVTNPRKQDGAAEKKQRRCTARQLTPLRQTAERLIATGLGNIYPDIWRLVHAKFEIEHINQLMPEQIDEAIDYLNALEGEYLPREQMFTPVPVVAPARSPNRILLYLDEYGAVQGSLPLQDDQVVMSINSFFDFAKSKGMVVMHRDELTNRLAGLLA